MWQLMSSQSVPTLLPPALAVAILLLAGGDLPLSAADSCLAEQLRGINERLERLERHVGLGPAPAASAPTGLAEVVKGLRQEVAALREANEREPVAGAPAAERPATGVRAKYHATLYGYLKLDAAYDTHQTANGDLAFHVVPKPEGRSDPQFNMTARESRLGLRLVAAETADWLAAGTFEADLYGGGSANSPVPRLRLAFADLTRGGWSLRAGQDWDTFISVIPRSLDFSTLAHQGALGLRRAQLRATRWFGEPGEHRWETRWALARTIGQDLDGGGTDDGVDAATPTFQWNVLQHGPTGWRAGVSGHFGREMVDVVGSAARHERYDTWSLIISWAAPVGERWLFAGSLWTGSNLDTYFGGVGQGVNRALGTSIAARGGFVQAVFNPTSTWNLNFTAGLDDPDDRHLSPGMRSFNRHLSVSAYWQWNPAVCWAFQLTHLTTGYASAADADALRLHSAVFFSF
jgi:hypothetical protein